MKPEIKNLIIFFQTAGDLPGNNHIGEIHGAELEGAADDAGFKTIDAGGFGGGSCSYFIDYPFGDNRICTSEETVRLPKLPKKLLIMNQLTVSKAGYQVGKESPFLSGC